MTDPIIRVIDSLIADQERAEIFGAFLDWLSAPTPAQIWLEQAAAKLSRQHDPDGSKKTTRDKLVIKLLQRDGHDCWFCARPLGSDVTLERLQPLALGGNWGEGNLVLAHHGCNKAAGHLPRVKKEALRRERMEETSREAGEPNKQPVANHGR